MDAAPALQLCHCGLSAASTAPRCRACPQQGSAYGAPARAVSAAEYAPLMTYSRWQKSTNTFGPTGRVVATVLLFVPLPIMLMAVSIGIGIIGAGIYVLLAIPWALRDIWKRAAIPVKAPPSSTPPPQGRF